MVLASRHTGSKSCLIGLSLCLLAVAGRATAQHSCSPGNTGQLCAACKPGWSRIDAPDGALNQGDCARCPAPTNCLGGDPPVCTVGSEGQLCAVCSAGWSRIDGLAPNEPCKECGVRSSEPLCANSLDLGPAMTHQRPGIVRVMRRVKIQPCERCLLRLTTRSTVEAWNTLLSKEWLLSWSALCVWGGRQLFPLSL